MISYLDKLNEKNPKDILLNYILKEIILATNQPPKNNVTSFNIQRLFDINHIKISVTRLVSGVPVGSNLKFIDRLTIEKALINRR